MTEDVVQTGTSENLIVMGWLVADQMDQAETQAISQARGQMGARLRDEFPDFQWRMPVVHRFGSDLQPVREPVTLLDEGVQERDLQQWDFVFVVTRSDLNSYYKPFALAVPSRTMAVAVISTARLAFQETMGTMPQQKLQELLEERLFRLAMHLFGDLNGVPHSENPVSFMYEPQSAKDLDQMRLYTAEEHAAMRDTLSDVADTRLEEGPDAEKGGTFRFYVKAMWIGLDDIWSGVVQAKPWEFPFRLNRLTTAAISTLVILLMTAEAWDLGMSEPPLLVTGFSLLALVLASIFIVKRHRLILRRGERRRSEQTVFKNVSIVVVVFLGMSVTYLMLFGLTLVLSLSLYPPALVEDWTGSLRGEIHLGHYFLLAGLISSLGILIGALGASFEGQYYFQHIIYVDEET